RSPLLREGAALQEGASLLPKQPLEGSHLTRDLTSQAVQQGIESAGQMLLDRSGV
ncbi:hypothetical protein FRC17_006496, partial [Serendipita sp. 399]